MSTSRPEVCVGAVVVVTDRILLVRRGAEPGLGQWAVPGGRIERGETVAEAVVREVAEETGLQVVCGPLLGVAERIGADSHFVVLDHTATLLEPGSPPHAASDADEVAFVPLWEVGDLDLVDGLYEFLVDHGILSGFA